MNIGQWRLKHTSVQLQPGLILFYDHGIRSTTGYTQFDCHANCAAITVPQGYYRQFRQHTSWTPERSWQSNQTHAGMLHGNLWKSRRRKSQNAVSCKKRSVSPWSTRMLQAVCWSKAHRVEILDWQRGFWPRWFEEVQTKELRNRSMGTYLWNRQAGQIPQGKGEMGIERIPGQTKWVLADRFSCFY